MFRAAVAAPVIAAALLASGARAGAADTLAVTPQQASALGVRVASPRPAGEAAAIVLQGQVVLPPRLLRVLSAPVPAIVEQVGAARGDAVRAGGPLVVLNAPQIVEWQREYRQAQLQLQLARETAARDQALFDEGIIAGARAQASRNQLQIAEAAARERGQLLRMAGVRPDASFSGRTQVGAPAAGTVLEVLVQPGQHVDAGAPLVKFAARGPLWLELHAPPPAARSLRAGDEVRVDGCDQAATVSAVNAQVEPGSQTVMVRAQWQAAVACVMPQQHVQAGVKPRGAARAGAWLVPRAAVVRQDGRDLVYLQRTGGFLPLVVEVLGIQPAPPGQPPGDWVQVLPAGGARLAASDAVVIQGAVALKGLAQGLGTP